MKKPSILVVVMVLGLGVDYADPVIEVLPLVSDFGDVPSAART